MNLGKDKGNKVEKIKCGHASSKGRKKRESYKATLAKEIHGPF